MPVETSLYDRAYYLQDCDGFREFARTQGRKLPRRLAKCLSLALREPVKTALDIGCGRGELALHLAAKGARAIAVDPSQAALGIAREAVASWQGGSGSSDPADRTLDCPPLLARAGGRDLPVRSGWADVAILADVVEHLSAPELRELLAECGRALRPGGRLVIHTQPNRTLVRITVPLLSRVSRIWGVRLPRDLRSEMTPGSGAEFHPGEPTCGSLRRALLQAGFHIEELWLEGSYAVHRIFGDCRFKDAFLRAFRRSRILKGLFATQIFALARRVEA
jgi:SAM-dependent methyltransferase